MTEQVAVDSRVDSSAEIAADDAVVARIKQRLREQGLEDVVGVNPGLRRTADTIAGAHMVDDIARRTVHVSSDYPVRINTGKYGEEAEPEAILGNGGVAGWRHSEGLEPVRQHIPGPTGVQFSDQHAAPGTADVVTPPGHTPQTPEERAAQARARVAEYRADRVTEGVSVVPVTGAPQLDGEGNLVADRVVTGAAPVLATSDSAKLAEAAEAEARREAREPRASVAAVGADQVPHTPAKLNAAAAELAQELPETTEDAEVDATGHVRSRSKRRRRGAVEPAEQEPEQTEHTGEQPDGSSPLEQGIFSDGGGTA